MLNTQLTNLVLTEHGLEKIDKLLKELVDITNAKYILLVEKSGQKIASAGEDNPNAMALSALVAGAFAATYQIAKLLGEREFRMMFQKGEHDNIFISLLDTQDLLTVVFDDRTTLGMIKLKTQQMSEKISKVIKDMHEESIKKPFTFSDLDRSKNNIDKIFKG